MPSDPTAIELARTALSLGIGDTIELIGLVELPDASKGFAAPIGAGEPLLMLLERAPFFQPQELAPPPESRDVSLPSTGPIRRVALGKDLPFSMARWETSPSVVVLEAEGSAELAPKSGVVLPWRDGALVVHVAAGPVVVVVKDSGRELVLVGQPAEPSSGRKGARLTLFEVHRAAEQPTNDIVTQLLDGYACEPWMLDAGRRLVRRRSALDDACAVGLLARLWVARDPKDRTAISAGEEGVARRARRLVQSWSLPSCDAIEWGAKARVEQLATRIEELAALAAENPAEVPELAHGWITERDDLASVAWCLEQVSRGRALPLALDRLDTIATANLSAFAYALDLGDDDRLLAVHWHEPNAWWGSFVDAGLDEL